MIESKNVRITQTLRTSTRLARGALRLTGALLIVFVACAAPTQVCAQVLPEVEYTVFFEATWSAVTHPEDFPPSPHFSGLIGGTHNDQVTFWEVDGLASPGIESMAETGSKTLLRAEVNDAILGGTAEAIISGGGISPSPGSVSRDFMITEDFPLVTLVSMVAPSPDWFVGTSGVSLIENGYWVAEKVVTLWPFDSGTDSGASYTSPNQDTNPQDPISLITDGPLGNGVPLGTFTFTLLTTVSVDDSPANLPISVLAARPNPSHGPVTLRWSLEQTDRVDLLIYDVGGRLVRYLLSGVRSVGLNEISWDGRDGRGAFVQAGVYYYSVHTPTRSERGRVVMVR
ncbi:spondin domain-containing protein [Candidatus Eisenbacteria bacterium]|uniref:Spondin domain-containing protein n=1 Tax=Eiseniibacteriota bacterium TaxID=2212470 RepID=A0ABV6YLC3_UNCEI